MLTRYRSDVKVVLQTVQGADRGQAMRLLDAALQRPCRSRDDRPDRLQADVTVA